MENFLGITFYIFSFSIPISLTLSTTIGILLIIIPFLNISKFLKFMRDLKFFYIPFFLLILSFLISSILSPFPLESFKKGRDFFFYLLFPSVLFISLIYNIEKEKTLNFLIAGGIISAFYSFFLLLKGSALEGRAHGFFLQPIRYAEFLLFPLSASFYFLINKREKKFKILYFIFFLILLTALFLTDSRGGVLASAVSIFTISLLKNRKISLFVLVLIVTTTLIFFQKSPFKIRKENMRKKSIYTRIKLLKAFPEFFIKRPLFGYGRIDIKKLLLEKDIGVSEKNKKLLISLIHFHFAPFQMLFYLGLIGTLFLYGIYFYIGYLLFKSKGNFRILGLSVLIGFLIEGIFGLNVIVDPNIFSLFLLTGLCIEDEDNSIFRL